MIDLPEIVAWIVEGVEALNATDYAQEGYAATWRRSPHLLVDAEGHPAGHLAFVVAVVADDGTDREQDHASGTAQFLAQVEVTFAYHLRPMAASTDELLAMAAASDVMRSLLRAWPEAVVDPVNKWEPRFNSEYDWLICTVSVTVRHEIAL